MRGTMSGPLDPPGFAATGRSMEVEGVDLWTMRDGRIARYRAFYDVNDLARQLAIAPPPEGQPAGATQTGICLDTSDVDADHAARAQ